MKGQKKPDLYVIVGPNGSGKSTIIENSGIADRCPIIINPDNFVKKFPDIEDLEQRYIAAIEYCRGRSFWSRESPSVSKPWGPMRKKSNSSGEPKRTATRSMSSSWTAAVRRRAFNA